MPNENFYVFKAPLTFDPSKSGSYGRDVFDMLNALPRTTETDPIHDIMNNALKQWVEEESKKMVKDDEIIRIYTEQEIYDGKSTSTRPYYYLEWEPDINFETWYLFMINTANQHGYNVYSDVDQRFYFADGTCFPKDGRQRIEAAARSQQEQIAGGYETVLKIMQEEANNPLDTTYSKHLHNVNSRVIIFTAILQHCFDKYGIKATIEHEKGEYFRVICDWQNEVIFLLDYDIHSTQAFEISRLSCRIRLNYENPRVVEELKTKGVYDRGGTTLFWNNRTHFLISYYEKHQGSSLDNETLRIEANKVFKAQNITNTVTALHHRLTQDIDNFVQTMYQYGNLYDFIDASYQETHPLHPYLWSSLRPIPDLGWVLKVAHYVGHPKLQEMIKKQALRLEQAEPDVIQSELEKEIVSFYVENYLPEHQKS